ncbi:MAG: hypothetical protein DDT32_02142 [Syntrophomonadaceae bacterium]|nr:hypothetical protein [Bacillota bacterium]
MEKVILEVNNLISFTTAAKMLGVSRPTVYYYIERHQLHPLQIGSNRYLLRHEVERLKEERG